MNRPLAGIMQQEQVRSYRVRQSNCRVAQIAVCDCGSASERILKIFGERYALQLLGVWCCLSVVALLSSTQLSPFRFLFGNSAIAMELINTLVSSVVRTLCLVMKIHSTGLKQTKVMPFANAFELCIG